MLVKFLDRADFDQNRTLLLVGENTYIKERRSTNFQLTTGELWLHTCRFYSGTVLLCSDIIRLPATNDHLTIIQFLIFAWLLVIYFLRQKSSKHICPWNSAECMTFQLHLSLIVFTYNSAADPIFSKRWGHMWKSSIKKYTQPFWLPNRENSGKTIGVFLIYTVFGGVPCMICKIHTSFDRNPNL